MNSNSDIGALSSPGGHLYSLWRAIQNDHRYVLKHWLQDGGDPNTCIPNESGLPILHSAIVLNKPWAVEMLIDFKVDVEKKDGHKSTPLVESVRAQNNSIVRMLIKAGADLNALGKNGNTPLYWAVELSDEENTILLLEKGAEVEMSGRGNLAWRQENVWSWAKKPASFNALIRAKVDPGMTDGLKRDATHYAAYWGCTSVIRRLARELNVDLNRGDDMGETPLMIAATYFDLKMCQTLLALGADPHLRNNNGQDAISLMNKKNDKGNGEEIRDLISTAQKKALGKSLAVGIQRAQPRQRKVRL